MRSTVFLAIVLLIWVKISAQTITFTYDTRGNQLTETIEGTSNVSLALSSTFIEGYMVNATTMRPVHLNAVNEGGTVPGNPSPTASQCDYVTVELHNPASPYALAFPAQQVILSTTGTATVNFPCAAIGNSYYIVIKGRNIIETWSAAPLVVGATYTYNFDNANDAYGSNMATVFGVPAIYSGSFVTAPPDNNTYVGLEEYVAWEFDFNNLIAGYIPSDLDGNGLADLGDYVIWEANFNGLVDAVLP